jgi:hypothetical protein
VNFEESESEIIKALPRARDDDDDYYDDIPIYPTAPCQCGCDEFWLTPWKQWLCMRCHPKPKGTTAVQGN